MILEPACPYMSLALGTVVRAGYCCYVRADQILISPLRSPGSLIRVRFTGKGVVVRWPGRGRHAGHRRVPGHGDAGAEVTDEPVQVIEHGRRRSMWPRASGMVCVRLPHESRAGRRVQKVWEVTATFACGRGADGSPEVPGRGAARARIHLRLLAHLAAPRGALLYSRCSREGFGGYSWV